MPYHRSEEHTSELQSHDNLVCRLLLEKKKKKSPIRNTPRWSTCGTTSTAREAGMLHSCHACSVVFLGSCARLFFVFSFFFFFNNRAPPEFYPLPLPALLPI